MAVKRIPAWMKRKSKHVTLTTYSFGGTRPMLFMAISTPRPERPSTQLAARKTFWPWMTALQQDGRAKWCYARPGRGAVALFDVENIETLHALLNQWTELIPATFDLYPLIDAAPARAFLAKGKAAAKPKARRKA